MGLFNYSGAAWVITQSAAIAQTCHITIRFKFHTCSVRFLKSLSKLWRRAVVATGSIKMGNRRSLWLSRYSTNWLMNGERLGLCVVLLQYISLFYLPGKATNNYFTYVAGTTDTDGRPIILCYAECIARAGLNKYEIAKLLLYYSSIPT